MASDMITAEMYLGMVACGARRLDGKRKVINDLNVFPIPDGDTGDNMYMTICSGVQNGRDSAASSLGEMSGMVSRGMLMGARGNSGVILSRIFAGIGKGLEGLGSADLKQFQTAMICGVREAYGAVSHPVEGTILTVIRESVEKAAETGSRDNDPVEYFRTLVKEMRESLKRTPELLGVLREAGVVDSGGAGMLCIAEGMLNALEQPVSEEDFEHFSSASQSQGASKYNLDDFGPDTELEFGYCTEFLLRLQTSKVGDVNNFDANEIKDWLTENGDSVVCFKDGSIVKVHVHTMDPGTILTKARQWGEFLTLKIENMTLQHSEVSIQDKFSDEVFAAKKQYGTVAVATGEGLVNAFKEAGADVVIEGGQTMNPSAGSFMEAFKKINAETIFVFPNNSNIIMTAQQAADCWMKENGRKVVVLGSKDPAAGYVALASMDLSIKDPGTVIESAEETISRTITAMVSKATRDAFIDGIEIHQDDFIGISRGKIVAASGDRSLLTEELSSRIGLSDSDVALMFHGADVPAEEAETMQNRLQQQHPRTEIMMNDGGQPVFDYIIALC